MNSPCNPTGRVLTKDEHQTIADFAIDHDLIVFTDEMYEKIIYDGRHALFARDLAGSLGAHDHVQRLFQGLCDDRLASRAIWPDRRSS